MVHPDKWSCLNDTEICERREAVDHMPSFYLLVYRLWSMSSGSFCFRDGFCPLRLLCTILIFFCLLSVMAILEAILDATFSIYAAKEKSRHLNEHFGL